MPSTDIIDLSVFQTPGSVDWPRAGAAGLIAMYARAGHGLSVDAACKAHLRGGASIGRPRGVYWYWEPETNPEKQAEMMVAAHVENGCELSPAVDVEDDGTPRGHTVPSADLPALLMRFLLHADTLLAAGSRTTIYTMPGFWSVHFAGDHGWPFRNRMLWVANYGVANADVPFPWDEYALWQHSANTIWSVPEYTDAAGKHHAATQAFGPKKPHPDAAIIAQPGHVDGVTGEVDCNVMGNSSMQDLMNGVQPMTPLDYSDVAHRQRALRRQGFDPGKLDGEWGPKSRAALVLLQKKLGIPQTGAWSAEVEDAIADITKQ